MIRHSLILLLFALHCQLGLSSQCDRGEFTFADLETPEKMMFVVRSKNFTTVEQFVCCLPSSFRSNYLVGMSSVAAQNGTPDSPRIIMSGPAADPSRPTSHPRFIITFNGGKEHNGQGQSVEMAYLNPDSKELEFLDLDFSQKNPHFSKNSTTCLACHGENRKVPMGGPKFIFDTFAFWPRFVGGIQANCNPAQEKIHNMMSDKAIDSIKSDKRYACLDKSLLQINSESQKPGSRYPKLASKIGAFDNSTSEQNSYRTSRWLASKPEFQKFKYFLLGYQICNSTDFEEWIPKDVVQTLFQNVKISAALLKSPDLKASFNKAYKDLVRTSASLSEDQVERMKSPKLLFKSGHVPNFTNMACDSPHTEETFKLSLKAQGFNDTDFEKKSPRLMIYLDKILRSNPLGQTMPQDHTRLFIEGHNYFLGTVSTSYGEETPTFVRGGASVSLALEHPQSDLRKMFTEVSPSDPRSDHDAFFESSFDGKKETLFKSVKNREQTCSELKKLSMASFSKDVKIKYILNVPVKN